MLQPAHLTWVFLGQKAVFWTLFWKLCWSSTKVINAIFSALVRRLHLFYIFSLTSWYKKFRFEFWRSKRIIFTFFRIKTCFVDFLGVASELLSNYLGTAFDLEGQLLVLFWARTLYIIWVVINFLCLFRPSERTLLTIIRSKKPVSSTFWKFLWSCKEYFSLGFRH